MPLEIRYFTLNGNHDYILIIVVDSLPFLSSFICAKCSETIDCESNLLLLSNGKPVCENCSYSCNVCKQVIKDEAIITGKKKEKKRKFYLNSVVTHTLYQAMKLIIQSAFGVYHARKRLRI